MFSHGGFIALFSILCAGQLSRTQASFTITLEKNNQECFEVHAPAPGRSLISANYEVIGEYRPDIPRYYSVSFQNLKNDASDAKKEELALQPRGAYSEVGKGSYQLCFRSKNRPKTSVEIGFNIHVEDLRTKTKKANQAAEAMKEMEEKKKKQNKINYDMDIDDYYHADSRVERVMEYSAYLYDQLQQFEDHRIYVKQQAAKHRDLSEDTFTRVIRWTVAEAIIVLIMAVGQVLYLRNRFNNQKRYF